MQAYTGQGDGSRWAIPKQSSMVDAASSTPDLLLDEASKSGMPSSPESGISKCLLQRVT